MAALAMTVQQFLDVAAAFSALSTYAQAFEQFPT